MSINQSKINVEPEVKLKPRITANTESEEKPYRPSIRLVKPVVSSTGNIVEKKSGRRSFRREDLRRQEEESVAPATTTAAMPTMPKEETSLAMAAESEMEKEKRLRAEAHLAFSQEDTRISQIDFDDVIKPYKVDFDSLLDMSNEIIDSLISRIRVNDTSLQGIYLF